MRVELLQSHGYGIDIGGNHNVCVVAAVSGKHLDLTQYMALGTCRVKYDCDFTLVTRIDRLYRVLYSGTAAAGGDIVNLDGVIGYVHETESVGYRAVSLINIPKVPLVCLKQHGRCGLVLRLGYAEHKCQDQCK